MDEYEFAGQKENEKVILVVRQHPWVFFYTGLIILLIVVIYLILFLFTKSSWLVSWGTLIIIVAIIYLIIRAWFVWWNKVYILTNDRIIAVDQSGWFARTVSEANLENILFINHEVKGPIKTVFNFGDVHIRASGVIEDELVLFNVYNPYDIQQEVVKAQKKITGRRGSVQEKKNGKENQVILR